MASPHSFRRQYLPCGQSGDLRFPLWVGFSNHRHRYSLLSTIHTPYYYSYSFLNI